MTEDRKEYQKEWRERNKEKVALSKKKYYEQNREVFLERAKAFGKSEKRKQWRDNNKEVISNYQKEKWLKDKGKKSYLSRYGLTLEQYQKIFEKQEGKCQGCKRHESELNHPLHVDHCHVTKKVRGLLCRECNALIGFAKDNPSILKNLINYLTSDESATAG